MTVERPAPSIVVVSFSGRDTGELGGAPFREMEKAIDGERRIELFIDARHGRGASVDVSSEWAMWLGTNRGAFQHVSMLTGSPFIQLSADFVRRFAGLGEVMRIYTEPSAFDGALASAVANARSTQRS